MLSAVGTATMALASRFKNAGMIVNEHTLTRAQTRAHVEALARWFEFIHLNALPARLGVHVLFFDRVKQRRRY